MTTCDMEIVSALAAGLTNSLGPERYELWFGGGTQMALHANSLRIYSPNPFMQGWLRANFGREVAAAARQALGREVAVEFLVADEPLPGLDDAVAATPPLVAAQPELEPPQTAPAPELEPLANRRGFSKLADFVVGRCNRMAYTTAQMVVDQVGSASPLYLHGPTGVGKTHLLEGIWSAVRGRQRNKHVVYLSAEQFTTYFLEALHGSGLPSFRRKYRGVDLLLIDDVQFLCGKRATVGEFLHTVDSLVRDGRQVVLAADRPPADLPGLGPELQTRLAAGLISRLETPDFDTRLSIVERLSRKLRLDVPAEVQRYVATHLTCHVRELAGALNCLQATSLALGEPITLPLAETALAERIRQSSKALRLADIEKAVCQVLGLESESLQAAGRAKALDAARMLAMWLARKHTRVALSEIGRYFGRRSHSTVISAQKRVSAWMADGKPVVLLDRQWTIEEAIQRVEAELRAG